ncbi:DMT family transporter [Ramlibacter sp. MAHUQ-53]|uniref:DMT family transporter n=1 Tax=unclassified Ramlibacter TaxID=2617605 RepID=UPI00362B6805
MTPRFDLRALLLLTLPPLLWAGNAVVGRLVSGLVPPMTLNLLRWVFAALALLPLAGWVLRPGSGFAAHWRRFAWLGLLGMGCFNSLQYLALHTSTPMNVTLVGASMPVFMMVVGVAFHGQRVSARQVGGSLLSATGVLLVLTRGDLAALSRLQLVPGDLYMLSAVVVWAFYSWGLAKTTEPENIRNDWAAYLLAQVAPGVLWSALFTAGEWALAPQSITWGWPVAAALAYVSLGASVVAYRCWGLGIQRMGPNMAAVFNNLTPLFAALLSGALLGELPHAYHALAFALIAGGIVVAARR